MCARCGAIPNRAEVSRDIALTGEPVALKICYTYSRRVNAETRLRWPCPVLACAVRVLFLASSDPNPVA
jgi:hypothetical protein